MTHGSGLGVQSNSRDDPFNPLCFWGKSSSPHSRLNELTREKLLLVVGGLADREVSKGGI